MIALGCRNFIGSRGVAKDQRISHLLLLLALAGCAQPVATGQAKLPACQDALQAHWDQCQGSLTLNGAIYVGEFRDGAPNGQGSYSFPDGWKYVGEVRYGALEGQGTTFFTSGTTYVGEHHAGKPNGRGTYTFPDGWKYVGEVRDNKYEGQGTEYLANGTVGRSGIWSNGYFGRRPATISTDTAAASGPPEDPERLAFRTLPSALLHQVQIALVAAGYYKGEVDGIYGPDTDAAIQKWQTALKQSATGYLSPDQIVQLLDANSRGSVIVVSADDSKG